LCICKHPLLCRYEDSEQTERAYGRRQNNEERNGFAGKETSVLGQGLTPRGSSRMEEDRTMKKEMALLEKKLLSSVKG
jgi:hypothetical protein